MTSKTDTIKKRFQLTGRPDIEIFWKPYLKKQQILLSTLDLFHERNHLFNAGTTWSLVRPNKKYKPLAHG